MSIQTLLKKTIETVVKEVNLTKGMKAVIDQDFLNHVAANTDNALYKAIADKNGAEAAREMIALIQKQTFADAAKAFQTKADDVFITKDGIKIVMRDTTKEVSKFRAFRQRVAYWWNKNILDPIVKLFNKSKSIFKRPVGDDVKLADKVAKPNIYAEVIKFKDEVINEGNVEALYKKAMAGPVEDQKEFFDALGVYIDKVDPDKNLGIYNLRLLKTAVKETATERMAMLKKLGIELEAEGPKGQALFLRSGDQNHLVHYNAEKMTFQNIGESAASEKNVLMLDEAQFKALPTEHKQAFLDAGLYTARGEKGRLFALKNLDGESLSTAYGQGFRYIQEVGSDAQTLKTLDILEAHLAKAHHIDGGVTANTLADLKSAYKLEDAKMPQLLVYQDKRAEVRKIYDLTNLYRKMRDLGLDHETSLLKSYGITLNKMDVPSLKGSTDIQVLDYQFPKNFYATDLDSTTAAKMDELKLELGFNLLDLKKNVMGAIELRGADTSRTVRYWKKTERGIQNNLFVEAKPLSTLSEAEKKPILQALAIKQWSVYPSKPIMIETPPNLEGIQPVYDLGFRFYEQGVTYPNHFPVVNNALTELRLIEGKAITPEIINSLNSTAPTPKYLALSAEKVQVLEGSCPLTGTSNYDDFTKYEIKNIYSRYKRAENLPAFFNKLGFTSKVYTSSNEGQALIRVSNASDSPIGEALKQRRSTVLKSLGVTVGKNQDLFILQPSGLQGVLGETDGNLHFFLNKSYAPEFFKDVDINHLIENLTRVAREKGLKGITLPANSAMPFMDKLHALGFRYRENEFNTDFATKFNAAVEKKLANWETELGDLDKLKNELFGSDTSKLHLLELKLPDEAIA